MATLLQKKSDQGNPIKLPVKVQGAPSLNGGSLAPPTTSQPKQAVSQPAAPAVAQAPAPVAQPATPAPASYGGNVTPTNYQQDRTRELYQKGMDSTMAVQQAKRDSATMDAAWKKAPKVDPKTLSVWAKDANGKYGMVSGSSPKSAAAAKPATGIPPMLARPAMPPPGDMRKKTDAPIAVGKPQTPAAPAPKPNALVQSWKQPPAKIPTPQRTAGIAATVAGAPKMAPTPARPAAKPATAATGIKATVPIPAGGVQRVGAVAPATPIARKEPSMVTPEAARAGRDAEGREKAKSLLESTRAKIAADRAKMDSDYAAKQKSREQRRSSKEAEINADKTIPDWQRDTVIGTVRKWSQRKWNNYASARDIGT